MLDSKNREPTIRVLVADSSRIHTQLLAGALKRDSLFEVIPFDLDSDNLVSVFKSINPDVLVISANLDDQPSRGFAMIRELRAVNPNARAVVLVDSTKDEVVLKAFRCGARGIFSKRQPLVLLSKCVRSVHQGQIWANSREMSIALEALASAPSVRAVNSQGLSLLSDRELQVVHCLAEGLSNREIAQRLKLSQHTVKNHLFRVFDKLGVSSRSELLFMTLTQPGPLRPAMGDSPNDVDQPASREEFEMLRRAAEAGLPAAQLALAQMYLLRRSDPSAAVQAYSWYLIAMKRTSQALAIITEMLTANQLEEARRVADSRLSKLYPEFSSDDSLPSGTMQ